MSTNAKPGPAAPSRLIWSFVLGGFASQLASAYYDVIRGPLLPPVMQSLHLEFTESASFFAVGHAAAALATLAMIWALNRWSERILLLTIGGVGAVAGLWAQAVVGFAGLLVLAALIGVAVTALGTLATILVVEGSPQALQARLLAALHSTYGIGCMAGSSIVGAGLAWGLGWPKIFGLGAPVYLGLMIFAWVKLRPQHRAAHERTVQSAGLSRMQVLVVVAFAIYVAAEVTTSMWLTSVLVQIHHLSTSDATIYVSGFFLTMTLSRLACAAFLRPAWERPVLYAALILPLGGFALGMHGELWGFALTGLCGPYFPVCLAHMSRLFPDKWRSLTIWIMVVMNVSIGAFDLVLGRLADAFGLAAAYALPPALFVLALVLLALCFRQQRRQASN